MGVNLAGAFNKLGNPGAGKFFAQPEAGFLPNGDGDEAKELWAGPGAP